MLGVLQLVICERPNDGTIFVLQSLELSLTPLTSGEEI